MRIGLVGCVKSKRRHSAPARDMYTSPMFRGRARAVESSCDTWFVLSAEHGLLDPDEVIEPYDVALKDLSSTTRRAWSAGVLNALRERLGDLSDKIFEIHAGSAYRDNGLVSGLRAAGATVENPTEGLNFGQQLARYGGGARPSGPPAARPVAPAARPTEAPPAWRADLQLRDIRAIDPFTYRWPETTEIFDRGWEATVVAGGVRYLLRHGIGTRVVFGSLRPHSVTFLDGQPAVEAAAGSASPAEAVATTASRILLA